MVIFQISYFYKTIILQLMHQNMIMQILKINIRHIRQLILFVCPVFVSKRREVCRPRWLTLCSVSIPSGATLSCVWYHSRYNQTLTPQTTTGSTLSSTMRRSVLINISPCYIQKQNCLDFKLQLMYDFYQIHSTVAMFLNLRLTTFTTSVVIWISMIAYGQRGTSHISFIHLI